MSNEQWRSSKGIPIVSSQAAVAGIGIAPEFIPQVFDAFSQHESTSTRRYRGLGLGLAIVKNLTELHGGRVQVMSNGADQGSTFEVAIPRALAVAEKPEVGEDAHAAASTASVISKSSFGLQAFMVLIRSVPRSCPW